MCCKAGKQEEKRRKSLGISDMVCDIQDYGVWSGDKTGYVRMQRRKATLWG